MFIATLAVLYDYVVIFLKILKIIANTKNVRNIFLPPEAIWV